MAVQMPEQIASRAITKAISTMDFNVDQFAVFFSRSGSSVQRRLFNMYIGMMRYWADLYRNGVVNEQDGKFYNMCVYSARILDILPEEV